MYASFTFLILQILINIINNEIMVLLPSPIHIKVGFSNFGNFKYGTKLTGVIYYDKNFNGCDSYQSTKSVLDEIAFIMVDE